MILVGSNTAADVFNLFVAAANGGIEDGVVVYGGNSAGDGLNVFGHAGATTRSPSRTRRSRPGGSTSTATTSSRRSTGETATVNGNGIRSSGLETIRLVKLGGTDTIHIGPGIAPIVDVVNLVGPVGRVTSDAGGGHLGARPRFSPRRRVALPLRCPVAPPPR